MADKGGPLRYKQAVEIDQLIAKAQDGKYGPVHLIVGTERFFVDRAVAGLRRAVVGEGDGFNEEVFHGKGGSAGRVLEAARTLPMMAQARFVLLRGADQLSPSEQELLSSYFADPSPSSCLVMTADKLDGRGKLAKLAKKHRMLSEAKPLKPAALRSFLSTEARRRRLKLASDAGAALADTIGTDLSAIDDALERLSLYVGDGDIIDLEAVEACVSRVRVESIWSLVDAVSIRDRATALRAASSLLGDREPPLRILAMVARQIRMVARMKDGLMAGMSPQEAVKAAGAPPFKARDLASAAHRFDPQRLARAFRVLAETDLALKGDKRPPATILEGAILELTG